MIKVRLTQDRTVQIVRDIAWGLGGGLAIAFTAMLILFGTGP